MADKNLGLQLLITAKDQAGEVFSKLYGFIDRTTSATANLVREAFSNLFGGGLKGAQEFEAQMDRVIAKGDDTYQTFSGLGKAIRETGADFGISGTEAAKAMEGLAAAGLDAKDAIGALPSVLALASSEQISADDAAQKLIDSLSIMGLGFEEAGRMADVLAKGANITTSSASQLAEALSAAGGMARSAGMSLEETVAALDLLHKNGIKGSEAGTALKTILTALLDPSSKASEALNALGITSRDLGSVLGELKTRGGSAQEAILAFGTEAGPGLRSLINEGKTGLLEYTAALDQATGSSRTASAQMGGNLKSAMESLGSIWETVKASLLEPALEPLAQAARDTAEVLKNSLGTATFASIQAAIKEFITQAIVSAKDFITGFDFSSVGVKLKEFADDAKELFSNLAIAGKVAASGIQLAWNALTISVKAIVIVFAGFAATILSSIEGVVFGLNKIGLAADKAVQNISEAANSARQSVISLSNGIGEDATDIKNAWNRINETISTTPDELGKIPPKAAEVKDALDKIKAPDLAPPAELGALIQDLDFYKTRLQQAQIAQELASAAARAAEDAYRIAAEGVKNGTISQQDYESALKAVNTAHQAEQRASQDVALARSRLNLETQVSVQNIDQESTAITANIKTKQQLFAESQLQYEKYQQIAAATTKTAEAAVAAAQAELALAKASGNKQSILNAEIALSKTQISLYQSRREELSLELKSYQEITARIETLTGRKSLLKDTELAELEQLKQKYPVITQQIEALKLQITTIDKQIATEQKHAEQSTGIAKILRAAGEDELEIRRMQALAAGDLTTALKIEEQQRRSTARATSDQAKEIEHLTEIQKWNEKVTKDVADTQKRWADESKAQGEFMSDILSSWAQRLNALSPAARQAFDGFSQGANAAALSVEQLREKSEKNLHEISVAVTANSVGIAGWARDIALKALEIEKGFLAQKIAVGEAVDALTHYAETGERTVDVTRLMGQNTKDLADEFDLLNAQDLDRLRSALDNANDKLREMQQETEDARTKLAEMNAELLEAQGMDEKANLLRQQLDYEQQLAEIEKEMAEAQSARNTDLIAILQRQKDVLEEIHRTKVKNIEAEGAAADAADKTEKATRTLAGHADNMERISKAMGNMAGLNFGQVSTQFNSIAESANRLRDVL